MLACLHLQVENTGNADAVAEATAETVGSIVAVAVSAANVKVTCDVWKQVFLYSVSILCSLVLYHCRELLTSGGCGNQTSIAEFVNIRKQNTDERNLKVPYQARAVMSECIIQIHASKEVSIIVDQK